MAIELSIEAEAFIDQGSIVGNIVLEIDGFPLFGAVKVTKVARIGEFIIGDGTLIGGTVGDDNSLPYIDLSGTTNNITQKIDSDKGAGSSITSFKVRLIDKDDELTRTFSPSVTLPDVLGANANVYWQASGSKFPEDAARLISGGIISSLDFGQGYIEIKIDLPQQLARQELLPKKTAKLVAPLNDSQTSILVDSTEGFVSPQDALTTYVRINDEIILVQAIDSAGFQNCVRGQFGTTPASAEIDDEAESFYRLQGDPIDLALKLLLSGGDEENFATETALAINQVSASEFIPNAIYFESFNIQDELGLTNGDLVSITLGADPSNLIPYTEIVDFGTTSNGSFIIVNTTLLTETDIEATCVFKSRYNLLNFGCGLTPFQTDVAGMNNIETGFSAQFLEHDIYIKDSIDSAKEFIESELFFGNSLFSLPRKGRFGVGVSAPPIVGPKAKTISVDTVTNAAKLKMSRSINNLFYNSIAYKINLSPIDDRFLGATIVTDETSQSRIKIGNRTLVIESGGIRDTPVNRNKVDILSRRLLDRYSLGAETLDVEVDFATGLPVEIGDTVILDGASLKLSDITKGSRDFDVRIFEIINKAINLKTGSTKLRLADTNLGGTTVRYGTFSPSSLISTGSTTNRLIIKKSFGTGEFELERSKWSDYINQKVRVRSSDYSFDEEVFFTGFDLSNPNALLVSPALSSAPLENYIIDCPIYDDTDTQQMQFWKALHCFWNPRVNIVSGTTTTAIVDGSDIDKFLVEALVRIHLPDYSEDEQTTIAEINANELTFNTTLGFSVTSSHVIDLIGFRDGGAPYVFY